MRKSGCLILESEIAKEETLSKSSKNYGIIFMKMYPHLIKNMAVSTDKWKARIGKRSGTTRWTDPRHLDRTECGRRRTNIMVQRV